MTVPIKVDKLDSGIAQWQSEKNSLRPGNFDNMKYQLPVLKKVTIKKDGNRFGCFIFQADGTEAFEKPFNGSLPFSKLVPKDWEMFESLPGAPDTGRMQYLEHCLKLIIGADEQGIAPVRFRTLDGIAWKIDRKVLSWLIGSKRYEFFDKFSYRDYGIRLIGAK